MWAWVGRLILVEVERLAIRSRWRERGVEALAEMGPAVGEECTDRAAIGFFSAVVTASRVQDKIYVRLKERNGGKGQPEYRVRLLPSVYTDVADQVGPLLSAPSHYANQGSC
jgi:hypothetical protein